MNTFQGFKPSGMEKIANSMGFQGNMNDFQKFLNDNPDRQAEMMRYQNMARKMVAGGVVKKMAEGGDTKKEGTITDVTATRVTSPKLPTGAVVNPYGVPTDDTQLVDPNESALGPAPTGTAMGAVTTGAVAPEKTEVTKVEATKKADEVDAVNKSIETAQSDPNDPRAKVTAQASTKSMVGDLTAAQGVAHVIDSPAKRELDRNEIIEPVANAQKAAKFTEEVQAATATPSEKATVAGQIKTLTEGLMLPTHHLGLQELYEVLWLRCKPEVWEHLA